VQERTTIAHVDAERGFSGGEVQVFLLMEGLRRAGWRNVLFAPPGSAALAKAQELGLESVAVPMRSDLDLPGALALRRGLERNDVDLVHLHTSRATWLGGWAARWAGLPALSTRRMDRDVKPGLRTRLVYERLTRRTVAISGGVAECLRKGGVPDERVRTIWSTVDPAALVARRTRADVRAELGVGAGEVLVLAAGRLIPRKGYDVLLAALAKLGGASERWKLAIAGDGDEHARLEAQARELGLAGRVALLGRRGDIADLLGACDVFAMPSRREGLGIAALEAMAVGRAVVASSVGGLGQAVSHGESGLIVPPEDVPALAQALERVIGDVALRERLGAGGRARVESQFHARSMVAAYESLYREILAEVAA
jgi:glycosyltransferase involved in cell wall biosynthesis